ncbi:MAG: hypothetical protein ACR2GZ_12895 [Solirubrobacteraceae bacterium]
MEAVHGAVVDELRAFDWGPRSLRRVGQIHAQLKRGLRDELAVDSRLLLEVA